MSRDIVQRQLRLRIFAGPNGSGKSTVTKFIRKQKIKGRKIDLDSHLIDLCSRGSNFPDN